MKIYCDHHTCRLEGTRDELREVHWEFSGVVNDQPYTLLLRHPDGYSMIWTGLLDHLEEKMRGRMPLEIYNRPEPGPQIDRIGDIDLDGVELRDYQQAAIRVALTSKRGIIEAGTGSGKTEIALGILKWLLDNRCIQTATIIVNTDRLADQTKDRMIARGFPEGLIGMVKQGQIETDRPILVAISNSLYRGIQSGWSSILGALSGSHALIFDECHHLKSQSWATIGAYCPAEWRFGFSATPFSSPQGTDLLDLQCQGVVGPLVYRLPSWILIEQGLLAQPEIHPIPANTLLLNPEEGDWTTVYREGIVKNEPRNQLIANAAAWSYEKGCSTVVFVQHKQHGHLIHEILTRKGYEDSILCTGGKEVFVWDRGVIRRQKWELDQLHRHISQPSISICTPFLDEGVDISGINFIVYAAANKHPRQLLQRLGRGMRLKENSVLGNRCIVIDFLDEAHPYLRNQSSKRMKVYRSSKLKIEKETNLLQEIYLAGK